MATAPIEKNNDLRAATDLELNTDPHPLDTAIVQDEEPPVKSICDLDELCLLKIFNYLLMCELLSVEKVWPQLEHVTKSAWRKFTSLDCRRAFYPDSYETYKSYLVRCGSQLKKIHFPRLVKVNEGKTCEFLGIINRHCPNVEHIILERTQFMKSYEKDFRDILGRLKSLEIQNIENFNTTPDELMQIFKRVSRLKYLTLRIHYGISAGALSSDFRFLPKTLISIDLGCLYPPDVMSFERLLEHCPNLEILIMPGGHRSNTGAVIAKFTKLRELELHGCDMRIEDMRPLLSLRLLEKLVLCRPFGMTDAFLEKIAESLPLLQHLDIGKAYKPDVTDKGVEKLAQLKHLEHLNLSRYKLITDKGIGAVAANGKLKELILVSTSVSDSVIPTVLTHCFELKLLDLSSCREITGSAVDALLEIFTPTNERTKLTVFVRGTSVDYGRQMEDARNLIVTSGDFYFIDSDDVSSNSDD